MLRLEASLGLCPKAVGLSVVGKDEVDTGHVELRNGVHDPYCAVVNLDAGSLILKTSVTARVFQQWGVPVAV